jgi:hypothetical protein
MQPAVADLDLLNHFSVLVYPFAHDITDRNRTARLLALQARWEPWWSRLSDPELAAALEASAFFLPYIRGLLFPECLYLHDEPTGTHYHHWVELLRRWAGRGLEQFSRHLPRESILRLTARPGLRAALAEFNLVECRDGRLATGRKEVAGRVDWADVLLFPSGLGFLLLKVGLREDRPGLGRLIALNSALRVVHPPSLAWTLPVLHLPATGEELRVCDLLNGLTQGLVQPLAFLDGEGGPIFLRLPGAAGERGYTDTEAGRAYGERCELLSYGCVHLSESQRLELPAGVFAGCEERLLFEYAACIGLGESVRNPMWVPSPEQAQRVSLNNRLAMWRCWKAMALKESLVFLGTEDLPFNRRTLAHNAENDYLALYVYTLYQKFQLLTYSTDLMREVARAGGHLRGARALQQRFVAFRNQFWFSEVTRKPMGGDLYRMLQQGLEVNVLYQMVTGSVKEAKEYYEEVWHRQVQYAKDVLTYFGPLTVILGAVRVLLSGSEFVWVVLGLLAVLAGSSAFFWLWHRHPRSHRTGPVREKPKRGTSLAALFRSRRQPWEKQPASSGQ